MPTVSHAPAALTIMAGSGDDLTIALTIEDGDGNPIDVSGWGLEGDKCTPSLIDGPAGRIDLVVDTTVPGDFQWGFRRTSPSNKRLLAGRLWVGEEPMDNTLTAAVLQLVDSTVSIRIVNDTVADIRTDGTESVGDLFRVKSLAPLTLEALPGAIDGEVPVYDGTAGEWVTGTAGVSDHDDLTGVSAADHHSNVNDPTADEKDALAGTGIPASTNPYTTEDTHSAHATDTTNPHSVTAAQAGAAPDPHGDGAHSRDYDADFVNDGGATPSIQANTRANQPVAGTTGRLYWVTDEDVIERDNGTSWIQVLDLAHRNNTTNPHAVDHSQTSPTADDHHSQIHGDVDHNRDYDADFVNAAGDTMSGDLTVPRIIVSGDVDVVDADGDHHPIYAGGDAANGTRRIHVQSTDANCIVRHFEGGYTRGWELRLDLGAGNENVLTATNGTGHIKVLKDFTVNGSKNAEILDPDDATKAFRFAAVEADRPGVLEHEIELDTGTTYSLPPHWRRIATNLRCYLQPLSQGSVWPEIDTVNWTVTPRGQSSKVLALIRADRADVGVTNWVHEVEVTPDEEGDI